MPYTTAFSAALSIALVIAKVWRQPAFPYATRVTVMAVAALASALLVGMRARRRIVVAPRWMNACGAASWILALHLGIVLSTIVVLALVKNVAADDRVWTWPYLNKRWLVALYMIVVGTIVVFPAAFEWWRAPGQSAPDRDASSATEPSPRRTAWIRSIPGFVAIVALAWWFAGPPWHLHRYHRAVESHEQAHLGALQAVDKGYLPYLGPASTQYGPGSQVLLYRVMRLAGPFDIVSFRTAWATFHFAALLAVAIAAYCWLGFPTAAAVLVLAVAYSPLAFYGTDGDGTLTGYYGWGSALRYIAPLLIVPTLVRASGAERGQRPLASPWVIALGGVWGAASWVSQENLSSTPMAAGLLLVLLCCTRTVPISRALRIGRDLSIGFTIAVMPVLVFYTRHGALGEMAHNYFVMPQAVAAGFSNTWWPPNDTARRTYYGTAPFVLALAAATLWRRPVPTLQTPLDARRAFFLAFVAVQLVCYQVALLRSDSAHLQNTMLAMPFILVLGARDLPRWLAIDRVSRRTIRIAFVIAALAIFPSGRLRLWRQILATPMTRFITGNGPAAPAEPDARIAYARMTPLLIDEPELSPGSSISMRAFLDFATDVHRIVGGRKAYVSTLSEVWTGPLYFFADLTPAPYPLDRDTMMLNDTMRARIVEHIRTHPADYECFIGASLDAPEARAFLAAHPDAERLERPLGADTVHILLSRQNR